MDRRLVPVDDSMNSRIAAYRGGDAPAAWTPEHVLHRLVEAHRVLRRSPWGGGGSGSGWPSLLIDMSRAVDAEARLVMNDRQLKEAGIAGRGELEPPKTFASDLPTPDQLSRMEEAIAWPMIYLGAHQIEADAVTIFAYAKATKSFDIRPFLQERMRQAMLMAKTMSREINASPEQEPTRRRRHTIALDIAATVNARLANVTSAEEAEEVKRDARAVMRERCAVENCLPVVVSPRAAAPGYCLARSTLDRARKRATAIIAAGLIQDRVFLR